MSETALLGLLQEVHILHDYKIDFYGQDVGIAVLGFIRPEMKFSSLGCDFFCSPLPAMGLPSSCVSMVILLLFVSSFKGYPDFGSE